MDRSHIHHHFYLTCILINLFFLFFKPFKLLCHGTRGLCICYGKQTALSDHMDIFKTLPYLCKSCDRFCLCSGTQVHTSRYDSNCDHNDTGQSHCIICKGAFFEEIYNPAKAISPSSPESIRPVIFLLILFIILVVFVIPVVFVILVVFVVLRILILIICSFCFVLFYLIIIIIGLVFIEFIVKIHPHH